MNQTVLARCLKDGRLVTLSVDKIENVQKGNFSGTLPCTATGISGEKYTIEPDSFGPLKEKDFLP